jgi:Flp pilus assembly protein TadD
MSILKRLFGMETDKEKVGRHLQTSLAHLQRGRIDQGIAEARAALALEPGNGAILHVIGAALLDAGRPEEAIPALEQAATLSPTDPEIQSHLGNACIQTNRFAAAAEAYRKHMGLKPGYPKMRYNLSMCLFAQDKMEEAIEEFLELLRIEPRDPAPLEPLEAAYKQLGKPAVGREEILKLKAQVDQGFELAGNERWQDAEVAFQQALELCPSCSIARAGLGTVLASLKRFAEARPLLETALAGNRECIEARLGMSLVKASQGDVTGAANEMALANQLSGGALGRSS